MRYSFYDDYSEGADPNILEYISANNNDQQLGYGNDEYCLLGAARLRKAFNLLAADVHFVPNGTIANVLGLTAMLQPWEGVIAPDSGHINTHEAGALEAAGHKILWTETPNGKLTPELIARVLTRYVDEHTVEPRAVYLTQATELGTVYSKAELEQIIDYAKRNELYIYLDGARLAMALASERSGLSAYDLGAAGIDMFSIGGTKNGGLYGEAVVILTDSLKHHFRNRMKQRGGLMAKGRFMGQQFTRFFDTDNLWFELAKNANLQASRLYTGLVGLGVEFEHEPDTNQIFPIMSNDIIDVLSAEYGFHRWQQIDEQKTKIRLVCSWATKSELVDEFLAYVANIIA